MKTVLPRGRYARRLTLENLHEFVNVTPSGCWEWKFGRNPKGYGAKIQDGYTMAHRVVFALAHGPIQGRKQMVLHRCDNPPCCNPDHLFMGDNSMNLADMASKGRSMRGERHHSAKLTADKVREIIEAHANGKGPKELSEIYGVRPGTIDFIVNRKTWRHVYVDDTLARAKKLAREVG